MRLKEKEGKKKSSFISIITNVRGNNVENKNGNYEINLDKKFTSERLLAVIKLKPYKKRHDIYSIEIHLTYSHRD